MESKIINNKEYRFVTVRGRSKWVSKDGDLINPFRNQESKNKLNKDGYPCTGGSIPVHLYVGYAWVDGYFEGAEINHKDFNRENFNADNLEWVTHTENINHSLKNNKDVWNKSKQGEKNGRSKLSELDVIRIREKYNNGMSVFDIVREETGFTDYKDIRALSSRYYYICNKKTWKNI